VRHVSAPASAPEMTSCALTRRIAEMAETGRGHPSHHRHRRPPAPTDRRRRVLIIAFAVLVACAVAAVLVISGQERSNDAVAGTPAGQMTAATTSGPTTAAAPVTTEAATASEVVPGAFAEAMGPIGIPLDPHTGWVIAQGICVRLGQPQYDQFRLAEGVERLFPSVTDEQAHAFVAMVATSVCHR
jgi:hypothetical protein